MHKASKLGKVITFICRHTALCLPRLFAKGKAKSAGVPSPFDANPASFVFIFIKKKMHDFKDKIAIYSKLIHSFLIS
jgi:hypothetical protein